MNMIKIHINKEDEETQRNILKSLDPSSYTKKELVELVRSSIEQVKKFHFSIFVSQKRGLVFFFPQHLNKLVE